MADPVMVLKAYAQLAPWNIRDLAAICGAMLDAAGIKPINAAAQAKPTDRTIRFYVTRHLMLPPDGRGTSATYGYRHLLQLLAIKLRQMEGASLEAIEKEMADQAGDTLEKRVAATLSVDLPMPGELDLAGDVAPRGRAARVLAKASREADQAGRQAGASPVGGPGWFRLGIGDGLEVAIRNDHPAARNGVVMQKVAEAVARALADAVDENR